MADREVKVHTDHHCNEIRRASLEKTEGLPTEDLCEGRIGYDTVEKQPYVIGADGQVQYLVNSAVMKYVKLTPTFTAGIAGDFEAVVDVAAELGEIAGYTLRDGNKEVHVAAEWDLAELRLTAHTAIAQPVLTIWGGEAVS